MSKKQLLKEKIMIEEKIKEYEKKLKEIEDATRNENSINEEEKPMPLYFNKITHKNLNRELSKQYTKMLINKVKNRSNKLKSEKLIESTENIIIKKEVTEEIEIPSFEYDNMPPLEYDDIPSLEYA